MNIDFNLKMATLFSILVSNGNPHPFILFLFHDIFKLSSLTAPL